MHMDGKSLIRGIIIEFMKMENKSVSRNDFALNETFYYNIWATSMGTKIALLSCIISTKASLISFYTEPNL